MSNKAHTRIQNIYDLRYYLSKLIGKVERGQITTDKAKALASISRVLLDTMAKEQEQEVLGRLSELEKHVGISNE